MKEPNRNPTDSWPEKWTNGWNDHTWNCTRWNTRPRNCGSKTCSSYSIKWRYRAKSPIGLYKQSRCLEYHHRVSDETWSTHKCKDFKFGSKLNWSWSGRRPLPASRGGHGTKATRRLRHHYPKIRTLDVNDIPSIHPQPNCTSIKIIVYKDEHKAHIYKYCQHRNGTSSIIAYTASSMMTSPYNTF